MFSFCMKTYRNMLKNIIKMNILIMHVAKLKRHNNNMYDFDS
jgi:hypothetical protein